MNQDFGAFNQLGWDKITDITVAGRPDVVMTTSEIFAPFMSYVGGETGSRHQPAHRAGEGIESFKQEFGRAPIGTGPFKFVEWNAKAAESSSRSSPTTGASPPHLDKSSTASARRQHAARAAAHRRNPDGRRRGRAGRARVDEALGIEGVTVLEHPSPGWSHLDLKHVYFLRHDARAAGARLRDAVAGHHRQAAQGPRAAERRRSAPGTWAFNPNIEPRPYDLEQAKALLAEAGLTPGRRRRSGRARSRPTIRTCCDGEVETVRDGALGHQRRHAERADHARSIAQSWNQASGSRRRPTSRTSRRSGGRRATSVTEKMTACLYSWFNGNDPDDMFYWHSVADPDSPDRDRRQPIGLLPRVQLPGGDRRADRAGGDATTDQEARKEIYWQIQELLHEEVPVIFIYWEKTFPAVAQQPRRLLAERVQLPALERQRVVPRLVAQMSC